MMISHENDRRDYVLPGWDVEQATALERILREQGWVLTNCTSNTYHPFNGYYVYGSKYTFRRSS